MLLLFPLSLILFYSILFYISPTTSLLLYHSNLCLFSSIRGLTTTPHWRFHAYIIIVIIIIIKRIRSHKRVESHDLVVAKRVVTSRARHTHTHKRDDLWHWRVYSACDVICFSMCDPKQNTMPCWAFHLNSLLSAERPDFLSNQMATSNM